jgi:CSLREA domain-containing protein
VKITVPGSVRCAIALALLLAAAAMLRLGSKASASTAIVPPAGYAFVVNTTVDAADAIIDTICETASGNGQCTLRAAIQEANAHPGSGIYFSIPTTDPGYSNGKWTIKLSTALPSLSAPMTINGPGANKLVVQRLNGNGTDTPEFRIFNVTTSGTVAFSGITIFNGSTHSFTDYLGGGIQNYNAGTVKVTNCTLKQNFAHSYFDPDSYKISPWAGGGGIANRAGGTINVASSTLTDNFANFGGGLYNDGSGTITVTNTVFSYNDDDGSNGGGIYNEGTITLTGATLTSNHSSSIGGGIYNRVGTANVVRSTIGPYNKANNGGGIYNDDNGTFNVTNSTIAYNSAEQTGETNGNGGGIYNRATLNVTNSTVAVNAALGILSGDFTVYGGGIYNDPAGTATIKSTIIANNSFYPSGEGTDVYGAFISQGYNLIMIRDGSTGFPVATDQTGTCAGPNPGCNAALDPQFEFDSHGPLLKNNGGPTKTFALLPYSPAIDRGTSNGLTGTLTTDQRGSPRTFDYSFVPNVSCFAFHHFLICDGSGDGADVGAVEFGGAFLPISVSRKVHGSAGSFDIYLVGNLVSPVAVEDRTGGPSQLLIDFPENVTVSGVSLTAGMGTVSSFTVNGGQVTVNLTGVTNAQTIAVTLSGVSNGTTTKNVSIPIGVLLGDTGNDGAVDSTDLSETQSLALSGQPINRSTFRFDINHDGFINNADVQLIQSKLGTHLP